MMPHVTIKMYTGRSEQQKSELADEISKTVMSVLNAREEVVSVSIEDVDPEHWATKVYKPEIIDKSETVYKKPGYNPFDSSE
jgi:4-oxalocrotonate tautomerase